MSKPEDKKYVISIGANSPYLSNALIDVLEERFKTALTHAVTQGVSTIGGALFWNARKILHEDLIKGLEAGSWVIDEQGTELAQRGDHYHHTIQQVKFNMEGMLGCVASLTINGTGRDLENYYYYLSTLKALLEIES